MAMELLVSSITDNLSKIIIQEYHLLGSGTVRHVEWIEKELRSMQGLLKQVEQHGYGEQEELWNEWTQQLQEVARDAGDVMETFVIKSVKRRRSGVLYWIDKHKFGKELEHIRKRMSDISLIGMNLNTNVISVTVETPPGGGEASSSTSTSVVAPVMETLDRILGQPIVIGDKVVEMVELVKADLVHLQAIVYSLKSTSERENVWLEEVKELCSYTQSVAGNFILVKERQSKMGRLAKFLYLAEDYNSEAEFKERMNYVRAQIGDAFRTSWTYGVGEQLYKQTTPVSTLLPQFSQEKIIPVYVKSWMLVDKNLKCAQRDLDLMLAFLRDTAAESEQGLMNERQKVWVSQLRLVAQNAQSIFDAYSKAGNDCLISRKIKYARVIDSLLIEILNISHRKSIYAIANIQGTTQQELAIATTTSPNMQQEREIQGEIEPPPAPCAALYQPVTGLKEKVQSMRAGMELMDALFRDVQNIGGELDTRSKIWVDQMDAIYLEAQSIINNYDAWEHESIFTLHYNHNMLLILHKKLDEIRNKIDDVSRRRKAYGLVDIQSSVVSSSSAAQILRGRTRQSLFVGTAKESSIVGFENDLQVLMSQLLMVEKRRCITWIVGIKGTGKTTLAKLIFQDNAVGSHFECCLWVSLPSNLNFNYTAQQLLEEISKKAAEIVKGDPPRDPVLKTLAGKKYLIVVDGIEEISQLYLLDTMKQAIPDMTTGSRLLLTTRNAKIAQHAAATTTTFIHRLQLLDDDSSWVLFTRHLKVDDIPQELIKVGREIVIKKCGGLPSEIRKISYLLSHKEEWSTMLNQYQIQSWSEMLKTINTDLPLYLRRCLSYFSRFPAEFGIPVRRLFVLWVAESMVVHHAGEDQDPPEQVAERYLTELIDRNMVQVATRKRNGKVKTCRLPNALRQLWLTNSNYSQFLQCRGDSNADPKNSIIRWVTDHLDNNDIWNDHIHGDITGSTSFPTYYKDVLSFLSFDTQEGSKPGQQVGNFLKGCISSDCFLLLRVLDLERVYKPKLPNCIARLSRLRYLGLRRTNLESLPSSMSKLLKLQTLDLKHTYIHTLPTSIWKMELRHLFLSETYHTKFPPQPKGNSLSDLQTLSGLFIDEEAPVKDGLDKLVNIKKLRLACQSMSLNQEAMIAQLDAVADWITTLEHLQSLRLKSRNKEGEPWVLHLKSFENNINLTNMYLLGSLSSSNIVSQFPQSLIELTLSHSKLEVDPMILLKDFPNLQTLCLLAESYTRTTMVCESQSFPQLHVLKIWLLERLDEWKIKHGALPCLRQLEIKSCRNLQRLPDGLKHVNTLLELKLTNMPHEINTEPDNIPPNCQVVRGWY